MILFGNVELPWEMVLQRNMISAGAFGVIGMVILLIGFKAFEKMTPRLDIEGELAKGNVAVGIFAAAMLIAMALILKMAIGG
jgi:putative membrane protein